MGSARRQTGLTQAMQRAKSIRVVDVPTPAAVELYGDRPAFLNPFAGKFSEAPCTQCPALCCQNKILVSAIDLARLVIQLEVPPQLLVDLDPAFALDQILAPRLNGVPQHMVLKQVDIPELGNKACHLLLRPNGQLRCGAYDSRPGPCRGYPFRFYTDSGDHFFIGDPVLCPVNWALTPQARREQEEKLLQWGREMSMANIIVRAWNRQTRLRTADAFFDFAVVRGARALGLDLPVL